MHFISRRLTILSLLALLAGYAVHARGLFVLYHALLIAQLMRLFH